MKITKHTIVVNRNPYSPHSFSVNTGGLLKEIANCTGQAILVKPIQVLGDLLHAVGERAAEINDLELNALMMKLAIYSVADGYSPDHNPHIVEKTILAAYRKRKLRLSLTSALSLTGKAGKGIKGAEKPVSRRSGTHSARS